MELQRKQIEIDHILIDPNNPRFFDLRDHEPVASDRYADPEVQEEALEKLVRAWDVNDLVRSILTNGFIEFELIVVKPYENKDGISNGDGDDNADVADVGDGDDNADVADVGDGDDDADVAEVGDGDDDEDEMFLVIEGNRRLAALKQIRRDHTRGLLASDKERQIAENIRMVQVLVFSGSEIEEKIIHGIRHVAGPKEWKGYQQGQLVQNLRENLGMDFRDIQHSLGLGPRVVQRVYQTSKAFEQMRDDEEYGDFADRELFSLFQEMLMRPAVRGWLEWSDDHHKFVNDVNRKTIYRMIARDQNDDDDEDSFRQLIHNPQEMRRFGQILSHQYKDRVLDRLLNGDISIEQAWATLEPGTVPWEELVAAATQALTDLPADQLEALDATKEANLRSLEEVLQRKLAQASRLRQLE